MFIETSVAWLVPLDRPSFYAQKPKTPWQDDLKTILFVEPGDMSTHAYPKHNRVVETLAKRPYPGFFQGHGPLKSKGKSTLEQERLQKRDARQKDRQAPESFGG